MLHREHLQATLISLVVSGRLTWEYEGGSVWQVILVRPATSQAEYRGGLLTCPVQFREVKYKAVTVL